ncbi:MAG: hypothetical protein K0S65_4668 [Labilithrix sp.]|nr:hypothetical protein [Labilithrix sp.]
MHRSDIEFRTWRSLGKRGRHTPWPRADGASCCALLPAPGSFSPCSSAPRAVVLQIIERETDDLLLGAKAMGRGSELSVDDRHALVSYLETL